MKKSVVITQSNYIPWKGYFDNIALADEVVLYDSVQYTRRDWRNRNKIKTAGGLKWLTVPVKVSGRFTQNIEDTRIQGTEWAQKHWQTIRHSYGKQPGFETLSALFADAYADMPFDLLSDLNRRLIEIVLDFLNIPARVSSSRDFRLRGDRTDKLVSICKDLGASAYLTGPAARDYLDEARFAGEGIAVSYFDNEYEVEYQQPFPPFVHQVSIVDLIACCGEDARKYMKHVPP